MPIRKTEWGGGGRSSRQRRAGKAGAAPAGQDEAQRHSPDAAREAALRLLERQRRTRADLSQRLRGRGFPPAVIDQILDRLEEVGLVDDRAYAEAFLSDRVRLRPRSQRLLRIELKRRGIADEVAAQAMAEFGPELEEVNLACGLLAQRAARLGRLEPEDCRRRAIDLLRRNGFSWDVIHTALAADILDSGEASASHSGVESDGWSDAAD